MLNYIKSELYRSLRSRQIREFMFVAGILVLFMNLVLFFMKGQEGFRYSGTSFSFSMIVSMPMVYSYVAADIAAMLYEGDGRNGVRGNSIACGISRLEIFAGKCIVSLVTALAILAVVLPVYILSAFALLEHTEPVVVSDMLMELPAAVLPALSALILAVLLLELFDKTVFAILSWLGIVVLVPKALLLAGMALGEKSRFLLEFAMWLPENFFSVGMRVNMSECAPIWDTAEGMARCLVSGTVWMLFFGAAGVLLLRRKEVS